MAWALPLLLGPQLRITVMSLAELGVVLLDYIKVLRVVRFDSPGLTREVPEHAHFVLCASLVESIALSQVKCLAFISHVV